MGRSKEEIAEASYQFTKLLVELCEFYRVDEDNLIVCNKNDRYLVIQRNKNSEMSKVAVSREDKRISYTYEILSPFAEAFQEYKAQEWLFHHLERVCAYLIKEIILFKIDNNYCDVWGNNNKDIIIKEIKNIHVEDFMVIKFSKKGNIAWARPALLFGKKRIEPKIFEILKTIYEEIFSEKFSDDILKANKYQHIVTIKEIAETDAKLHVFITLLSELEKSANLINLNLPVTKLQEYLKQLQDYCIKSDTPVKPSDNTSDFGLFYYYLDKNEKEYSYKNIYEHHFTPPPLPELDDPSSNYLPSTNRYGDYNRYNLPSTNLLSREMQQAGMEFLTKYRMSIFNVTIPQNSMIVHQLEKNDPSVQKMDDALTYVTEVISNYSTQYIRDSNAEIATIAEDKIEMKLLMTFQDEKERQKWLPGIASNGVLFCYKGFAINLNEHIYNEKALEEIASKYGYALGPKIPAGYISLKTFTTLYGIISGCVNKNNELDYNLINRTLLNKFDIVENNIYAPIAVPDYSSWQPSDDVYILYKYINPTYNFSAPGCKFICFNSKNGALIYSVIRIIKDDKYLLLPVTNWVKDNENPASFFVMPQGKAPLLNLDFINSQGAEIILTDDLELAYKHGTEYADSGLIWTSWYGGKKAMTNVDWSVLEGRKVYCFFKENDENLKDRLSVLMKLFEIFNNFKQTYLNIIGIDQNGKYEKIMHKDFVAYAQKQGVYIPKKIKELYTGYVEFDRKEKHEIKYVIDGIIRENSLTMIYAPSGIGKTWLSMSIAQALAKGDDVFEGWENSSAPRGVGIFFGEMDKRGIDNRATAIRKLHIGDIRNLLSPPPRKLELSEPEDQKMIDNYINTFNNEHEAKMSVLILDNLNTLASKATSQKGWSNFFKWIEEKKKQGITVILIHHPNKDGKYFGSSHILNTVDLMIHAADKDQIKTKLLKILKKNGQIIEDALRSVLVKDITMFLLYDKERYGSTGKENSCKISLKNLDTDQVFWKVESPDYESLLNEYDYSLDDFSQDAMDELVTGESAWQYFPKETEVPDEITYPSGKAFKNLKVKEQAKIIETIWVNNYKTTGKSISTTKLAKLLKVSRSKIDSIRKGTKTQVNDFKIKYPEYFNSVYYQSKVNYK